VGGYAAFLTAIISLFGNNLSPASYNYWTINLLLLVLSIAYFWILAVQNWFYNLWADYVTECEERIVKRISLRPLDIFADKMGSKVNIFHPAFYWVELVITIITSYFLYIVFAGIFTFMLQGILNQYLDVVVAIITFAIVLIFIVGRHLLLVFWDPIVYKLIIKRFSNIYKPKEKKNKKSPTRG
jgi:ABC-type multidrug transport system fused ATPase/permease subunit